jgi:hypothetical protein
MKKITVSDAFETATGASLYDLTGTYNRALLAMEGGDFDEETIRDTLDGLEGELAQKTLRVIAMAQALDSRSNAITSRIEAMAERAVALQNRSKYLREYAMECLKAAGFEAGDSIESPELALRIQKNPPKVNILNVAELPDSVWTQPPTPPKVVNKSAIAEMLKAGIKVSWAELIQSTRLVEK